MELPLVSLVVISYNLSEFVGEAIASTQAQSHSAIEIVVVDNGSEDDSRGVIEGQINGDPRCRVVRLERNLGHLGAFLHILPSLRGTFVSSVDADDALDERFVALHLQTHLGVAANIGMTSSNVIETSANGAPVTSGYEGFGDPHSIISVGLRDAAKVPRLPSVSDEEYVALARAVTVTHAGPRYAWIWAPGTANMYRRSVLDLIAYAPEPPVSLRGVDNYLNPLCHVLAGTAFMDLPLSRYRLHGRNTFKVRETVHGLATGRPEELACLSALHEETVRRFLECTPRIAPAVRERYWAVFDHLAHVDHLPRSSLTALLRDTLPTLDQTFSADVVRMRLAERLTPEELAEVTRGVPAAPPRRSVAALRQVGRAPLIARRYAATPIGAVPGVLGRDVVRRLGRGALPASPIGSPALPEPPPATPTLATPSPPLATPPPPGLAYANQSGLGPLAILELDPPILMSGIAFLDYLGIAPTFGRRYGNVPAGFLLYPTWSLANPRTIASIASAARAHAGAYPEHRVVVLANTAEERDLLRAAGLQAVLVNKNIVVSEQVFQPLDTRSVVFDAVYNARFDPNKRHELTAHIPRCAYVTYDDPANTADTRREQRDRLAQALLRHPGHVLINELREGLPVRLAPADVNVALGEAAVGLSLSRVEGANNASIEYLMAGLPVVSTPSSGGREVWLDPEFSIVCDPDPAAVADAVRRLAARNIPRQEIRARTLERVGPMRQTFLAVLDEMRERLGAPPLPSPQWPPDGLREQPAFGDLDAHLDRLDERRSPEGRRAAAIDRVLTPLLEATPGIQLTVAEVRPVAEAIRARHGCRLLVFGCGNDSALWEGLNSGGTTVFLEDDEAWISRARERLTRSEVHHVTYTTMLSEWRTGLDSPPSLSLPPDIAGRRYDVILVDGPAGDPAQISRSAVEAPGRAQSIVAAADLVADGGTVFVHDCERAAEGAYASRWLGDERLTVEVRGRALLRGYAF